MNNPCAKNCKNRSAECHGTCKDYKRWKENHEAERKNRRLTNGSYPAISGGWSRTYEGYWRNDNIIRRR